MIVSLERHSKLFQKTLNLDKVYLSWIFRKEEKKVVCLTLRVRDTPKVHFPGVDFPKVVCCNRIDLVFAECGEH